MNVTEKITTNEHLPSPKEILESWRSVAPKSDMALCQKIWQGKSLEPIWLLGRNEATKILLEQGLRCAGVIDDFTDTQSWMGLPIKRFDQLSSLRAVVVNCAQSNFAVEASLKIAKAKSLIGLNFSDFVRANLLQVEGLPTFSKLTHKALNDNPDLYEPLWEDLQDPISRRTFADVLNFRVTTDPWFLRNYSYRPNEQYFEEFLGLPTDAVFIDAGAFQGETSMEFAKRYPKYGEIHAFEPSNTNADILEEQTLGLRDFKLYRVGLSDKNGVLRFSSEQGSASLICEDGNTEIKVIRMDDLNLKRADLIKMDLEGGENLALLGSTETIRRCRSKLSIGAYHDPKDFAKIHQTLKIIHKNSKFLIRHYTNGWAETDLFCIPTD